MKKDLTVALNIMNSCIYLFFLRVMEMNHCLFALEHSLPFQNSVFYHVKEMLAED